MMKRRILLLWNLFGFLLFQNEAKWEVTPCDPEGIDECLDENRTCQVLEDGTQECGSCEVGYIDNIWDDRDKDDSTSFSCIETDSSVWDTYRTLYDPVYTDSGNELLRPAVLQESVESISEHNAMDRNSSYTLGLTPLSADTTIDYQQRSGYFYVNVSGTDDELSDYDPMTWAAADIPKTIDWVSAGAVTSVKDQGRCGCSWATGVSAAIEGAVFLADGYNESISFQQFISCNKRNLGCDGGSITIAAIYASDNWFGGVTTLEEIPYRDASGKKSTICDLGGAEEVPLAVKVTDLLSVGGLDATMTFEERLELFKLAVVEKPISVIMKSSCPLFSNYISGILTNDGDCACSNALCYDHAVLLVGYDDTGDIPYFKLKNSWGTRWGEDGYFRVAQIEKGEFGLFGIFGEGLMVDAVQNKVVEVVGFVEEQSFPLWAIISTAFVSSLVCCGLVSIVIACWGRSWDEKAADESSCHLPSVQSNT